MIEAESAWESGAGATVELAFTQGAVGAIWLGAVVPDALGGSGDGALALVGGVGAIVTALQICRETHVTEADEMLVSTSELVAFGVVMAGWEFSDQTADPVVGLAIALPASAGIGAGLAIATDLPAGDVAVVRMATSFGVFLGDVSLVVAPVDHGAPVATRYLAGGLLGAATGLVLAHRTDPRRAQVNSVGLGGAMGAILGVALTSNVKNGGLHGAVIAGVTGIGMAIPIAAENAGTGASLTLSPAPGGLELSGRL